MVRRAKGNLPAEVTSFVGRRSELARARQMLSKSRVLTFSGPGGVGKTRLARRLADTVARAFPDGVWMVELADVHDGDLVPTSAAEALGLRADSTTPLDGLTHFLADKRLLLVLDNCEHLINACATLVDRVLATTDGIRILATSREVLGVGGEQVLPIPPLSVPGDQGVHAAEPAHGVDALELLTERITAANPEFRVTEANRGTLEAICRRLEGIPLAVELAALRFRVLSPEQILSRLDDSMGLLTTGPRTAPERQQTIDAAVRWSYDLCTPREQRLWEQLAVFAGGFDLDAVEDVCVLDTDAPESIVDALTGLIDKSVVSARHDAEHGSSRYFMLEPLRQFGQARLAAASDEHAVRVRHRDYYQRLAVHGHTAPWGPDDILWFHTATREHANLRAALRFSLDDHAGQNALETATGLRQFWEHCGFLLEGYRWLSRALAETPEPTVVRARALSAAAFLGLLLGETEAAVQLMGQCAQLAAELDVRDVLAETAVHSSLLAFVEGDVDRALALAVEAERRCLECGHLGVATESLAFAFMCAFIAEDAQAGAIAKRFLALTSDQGSHLLHGLALWSLGLAHWRDGDQQTATVLTRESIELFELMDRSVLVASGFDGLAWTAAAAGEYDRAARLMGAAKTVRRRSTMRLAHAMTSAVGDPVQREVSAALGEQAFAEAFAEGAALSLSQATDYALGRIPADTPPRARQPQDVLTRRERDVSRLVAAGHSNKRIAAELVISIRTAESHVEHILTKLGFHTRAQIASWVRENEV